MTQGYAQGLFTRAADGAGLHPFPRPSANLSSAWTNPYGCSMAPCTYCGFCERFGCANYSKASPQTCVLPALVREPNFEARTDSEVTRITLSPDGKHATGVTYVDLQGQEWEQPADLVLLCAFGLFNVRMLLLSGIGKPYDPATETGVVGRNYAYQTGSGSTGFFDDARFNPFAAAGSLGVAADDYNSDNFDHGPHGFVGGASLTCAYTNGRPILNHPTPPGTPAWGSAWKRAVSDTYQRVAGVGAQGSVMSYRNNYLDLDPTYKDPLGRPLMRMTFDYKDNERKMASWMADRCDELLHAMGAKQTRVAALTGPWSVVPYQTTHNTGGAIMGSRPQTCGGEPLPAVLGRAQRVRHGRLRLPAERRLQPDRHGGRAHLLVVGGDPHAVPEEPPARWCRRERAEGAAAWRAAGGGAAGGRAGAANRAGGPGRLRGGGARPRPGHGGGLRGLPHRAGGRAVRRRARAGDAVRHHRHAQHHP